MWSGLSTEVCAAIYSPAFLCRWFHVSQFQSPRKYVSNTQSRPSTNVVERLKSKKVATFYTPIAAEKQILNQWTGFFAAISLKYPLISWLYSDFLVLAWNYTQALYLSDFHWGGGLKFRLAMTSGAGSISKVGAQIPARSAGNFFYCAPLPPQLFCGASRDRAKCRAQ